MNVAPSKSRIELVIGGKGAGKSTIVKAGVARTCKQAVVWDLAGEYADPKIGIPGARLWTDLAQFRDHLLDDGEIGIEVFACPRSQFRAFCRWVYLTGDLFVVIEELARYCSAGRPSEELADLFDRSRHARIDLVCASSRLAEISKSLVHQADELVTATCTEPNDVDYLKRWLGHSAAARVRTLPPHSFLRIRL